MLFSKKNQESRLIQYGQIYSKTFRIEGVYGETFTLFGDLLTDFM